MVFEATERNSKKKVAIKKTIVDGPFTEKQFKILAKLDHPNILRVQSCFYNKVAKGSEVSYFLNIVSPIYPTDMARIIQYYRSKEVSMPAVLFRVYAYQMVKSLVYLEAVGVLHGNIQPSHFLVDINNHAVVLGGFGRARSNDEGTSNAKHPSPVYLAPETLLEVKPETFKSDVWAVGCVCLEMLAREQPFQGKSKKSVLLKIFSILGLPKRSVMRKEYKLEETQAVIWSMRPSGLKEVSMSEPVFKRTKRKLIGSALEDARILAEEEDLCTQCTSPPLFLRLKKV